MKRIEQHADEIGLQGQQLAEMRALVEAVEPTRRGIDEQISSARVRLHALMQVDASGVLEVAFVPTSENLVAYCWRLLDESIESPARLCRMRLYETPNSWADMVDG